jgi:hypothetical protein
MPSDDEQSSVKDSRTVCKYGAKCYQKNPAHHKAYKHPPPIVKNNTRDKRKFNPYKKNKESQSDHDKNETITKYFKKCEQGASEQVKELNNTSTSTTVELKIQLPDTVEHEIKLKLSDNVQYHNYKDTDSNIFKQLFLVDMPDDFFKFYEWLQTEEDIEKMLGSVNLELIGPYDLLMGKLPILDNTDYYLLHWRFYYDPPEFQVNNIGL